jgi:hypothetical protein
MTTKFTLTGATGTFTNDEIITGQTSGATAVVVKTNTLTQIAVNQITGNFIDNETIVGGTSTSSATLTDIVLPTVDKYSGRVMYIRNQSPVYRSASQIEDYRITVKF